MGDIGKRIVQLRLAQGAAAPIGKTAGLVNIDPQHVPNQRIIGDLFAQACGHASNLGIKQRLWHAAEIEEDFDILAGGVKHLFDSLIRQNREEAAKV